MFLMTCTIRRMAGRCGGDAAVSPCPAATYTAGPSQPQERGMVCGGAQKALNNFLFITLHTVNKGLMKISAV
ncbi:hypothetical protein STSP2_03143 [Anaerohalosphaera lusitana]|uniref:Uncharacterized protein n=1 Tax=Anaerohalosphaera lusitana TaxID=1936003 RepID=A0A1U9NPT6_9BACT|nr:hypothetical protein STSP2_03143 [Anaerohalosphaera lusitana]